MTSDHAIVIDDFTPIARELRADALASQFVDYQPVDGEIYKRVCIKPLTGIQNRIERVMGPVDMLGMGYRLNHSGELPNSYIHSDIGWGTHAFVLYLSDGPGGTAFWRHKETGLIRLVPGDADALAATVPDLNDSDRWDMTNIVEMKFNRATIYDSTLFHSRYPFEAFGDDNETGRLVAVAFFTPKG